MAVETFSCQLRSTVQLLLFIFPIMFIESHENLAKQTTKQKQTALESTAALMVLTSMNSFFPAGMGLPSSSPSEN